MSNVQKNVGDTATFTAVVKNQRGLVLTDIPVAFVSDIETLTIVDALDATVVGSTVETITVTATAAGGVNGDVVGTAAVDFVVDNVPATVEVTVS